MKLRPARRKKHCKFNTNKSFPIIINEEVKTIFTGIYNGFCVKICSSEEMNCINSMGFFGKANLSRSYPNFNAQKKLNIIRKRQKVYREQFSNIMCKDLSETVISVNDTDSENEDFIINSSPEIVRTLPITETLNLSLEEAYFLSNDLKCLNVYDFNNKLLNKNSLWELFVKTQPNFIQNYVVYHYLRARNWVVKSGLKFGGDFLLYKQGPPFFHASYVVIISVITSDKYERIDSNDQRSVKWVDLIGLNRLTETAAKEIVICQVIWPTNLQMEEVAKSSDVIKSFSVNTILMRRWIPKQERKSK